MVDLGGNAGSSSWEEWPPVSRREKSHEGWVNELIPAVGSAVLSEGDPLRNHVKGTQNHSTWCRETEACIHSPPTGRGPQQGAPMPVLPLCVLVQNQHRGARQTHTQQKGERLSLLRWTAVCLLEAAFVGIGGIPVGWGEVGQGCYPCQAGNINKWTWSGTEQWEYRACGTTEFKNSLKALQL